MWISQGIWQNPLQSNNEENAADITVVPHLFWKYDKKVLHFWKDSDSIIKELFYAKEERKREEEGL